MVGRTIHAIVSHNLTTASDPFREQAHPSSLILHASPPMPRPPSSSSVWIGMNGLFWVWPEVGAKVVARDLMSADPRGCQCWSLAARFSPGPACCLSLPP